MFKWFKWFYEESIVVNTSVSNVWDHHNPYNWPKWIDEIESCDSEKIEDDCVVKAKIKNKNIYLSFLFTEVSLHKKHKMRVKVPFFTQEISSIYEEISPGKTKMTSKYTVTSFFTPFLKSYYLKQLLSQRSKRLQVLRDTFSLE
jgi:hypothetical protein